MAFVHRDAKNLLGIVLLFSAASFAQQNETQTTPKPKASPKEDTCPDVTKISSPFRDIADDALAKLQALEKAELKSEMFYQPAHQEANVAVHKAQGKADGPCETKVALFLQSYQLDTEEYRLEVETLNLARRGPGNINPNESKQTQGRQQKISQLIRQALAPQQEGAQSKTAPSEISTKPLSADSGKIVVESTLANAEIFVDGDFVGNAPATLKLKSGKHTIRGFLSGYKEWTKDISV